MNFFKIDLTEKKKWDPNTSAKEHQNITKENPTPSTLSWQIWYSLKISINIILVFWERHLTSEIGYLEKIHSNLNVNHTQAWIIPRVETITCLCPRKLRKKEVAIEACKILFINKNFRLLLSSTTSSIHR